MKWFCAALSAYYAAAVITAALPAHLDIQPASHHMTTTAFATVAERRAAVAHAATPGTSTRAIATQLGISKDTVRRDLRHLAHTEAPDAPQPDPPAHTEAPPGTDPTTWPTHLTIPYDHHLHYDLRWLHSAGLTTPEQAIRWALATAAAAISAEYDRTRRMPTITPGE